MRIVRLTRIFRIFKISRYSKGMRVLIGSLVLSARALSLLVFLVIIAVVMFGSIMFYFEKGELVDGIYIR